MMSASLPTRLFKSQAPQFQGIVHIPSARAVGEKPAQLDAIIDSGYMNFGNVIPAFRNMENQEELVLLTNNDAKTFLETQCNVTLPPELQNQSLEKFNKLVDDNPQQYGPIRALLDEIEAAPGVFFNKVFQYLATRQAAGNTDIDGQPIEVISG